MSTTTPKSILDIITEKYIKNNGLLPIIINGFVFALYVMCFVSLFKPYLELIGYGLFFSLHVIMSIGIMKNIMDVKIDMQNIQSTMMIIPLLIGLVLLFVSFILLLITFSHLHAKHAISGQPSLPAYIPGNTGEVISGYTYQPFGQSGAGYYLNMDKGTDFYFNNRDTKKNVDDFKIIAITTTVLIWAEYLIYMNRELLDALLNKITGMNESSLIIRVIYILFGVAILALSGVCVWLTNEINNRTRISQDPAKKVADANDSNKNAASSTESPTVYSEVRKMINI